MDMDRDRFRNTAGRPARFLPRPVSRASVPSPTASTTRPPQPPETAQIPIPAMPEPNTVEDSIVKSVKAHLLSLPTLSKADVIGLFQLKRAPLIGGVLAGLVIIGIFGNKFIARGPAQPNLPPQSARGISTSLVVKSQPGFKPVIPRGKVNEITSSAGYDSARSSYTFSDNLDGAGVTISEQPLPTQFGTPEAAAQAAAQSVKAQDSFILKDGTAYMATNENGSQVIVFSRQNLLIFIQSLKSHSKNVWQGYIDTFEANQQG